MISLNYLNAKCDHFREIKFLLLISLLHVLCNTLRFFMFLLFTCWDYNVMEFNLHVVSTYDDACRKYTFRNDHLMMFIIIGINLFNASCFDRCKNVLNVWLKNDMIRYTSTKPEKNLVGNFCQKSLNFPHKNGKFALKKSNFFEFFSGNIWFLNLFLG